MDDFAWFLYKEDPDIFQNVHRVKRLLSLADRRFRNGDNLMQSFFNPCTHGIKGDCWALSCHHRLNTVLVSHGIEMIASHENTFALQTLENTDDILTSPHELFSMCICLWLLRTHCCIRKVVINVATVARFCTQLFWRLLSLNVGQLDKVELTGLPTDQSHFRVFRLFENATGLSEIIIAHIALSDKQVKLLCSVLAQNETLNILVLKYASISTMALQVLSRAITKYSRPKSFELREKTLGFEGYEAALARLLDTPVGKLCLEAPCNWVKLLKRLHFNTCLSDLEILDRGASHTSLKDLADALLANSTLKHLTLSVRFPRTDGCTSGQCLKLTQSIDRNQRRRGLRFTSLKFCKDCEPMVKFADAIAQNKSLITLSVEECDLSLVNLFLIFLGLSDNDTMETLHIGHLVMDDEVNRLIFERIAELDLGERVECVYAVRSEWLQAQSSGDYEKMCIRKIRVLYSYDLDGDCFLNSMHRLRETLTALLLQNLPDFCMSCTAAQCLADVFANSNLLHATLVLDADTNIAVTILEGLALSRTIYSVVVGKRWQLSGKVAITFGEMLRKNSSIADLTVWQETRRGFEELKAQLRLGVQRNYAINRVRLLYGSEMKESHDWLLLQMLQNNRIAVSWAADIIRGCSSNAACMYAFNRIKTCDNCWMVLNQVTGCEKEELKLKMAEACKRSEKELFRLPLGVPKAAGETQVTGGTTDALCTLNTYFVEEFKVFVEALKRKNKSSHALQT